MKEDRGKKRSGYRILFLALVCFGIAWLFPYFGKEFWFFASLSVAFWFIASFFYIIQDATKKANFGKYLAAIILLVASPMAFAYLEASRGIAEYRGRISVKFVVYEIIAAFIFIGSLYSLLKMTASHYYKRRRG